jgi:serine protease AprX
MSRVLKVFGTADERRQLVEDYGSVADYDAFTLVEVSDAVAKSIARTHLAEDITGQYLLRIGDAVADTSKPRVTSRGTVRPHKAYAGVKTPGPGRHHYIVQFVGPIKSSWLARVKNAGGEPRAPYQGFAYVVRADKRALAAISALPIVRWVGHLPHYATRGLRHETTARRRQAEGRHERRGAKDTHPRRRVHGAVLRSR